MSWRISEFLEIINRVEFKENAFVVDFEFLAGHVNKMSKETLVRTISAGLDPESFEFCSYRSVWSNGKALDLYPE
jgi:hypothetical protein